MSGTLWVHEPMARKPEELGPSGESRPGWRNVPLGSIGQIVMGQSPRGTTVLDWDRVSWTDNGLPFVQGNAEFGPRFPAPVKWCLQPIKVVQAGDVLISVRAPVGETNRADRSLAIGRGLAAIRFKHADPSFGWHALNHAKSAFGRVAQGSTFDAIGSKELLGLSILLPPLPEQRAIAAVLDAIDEAIERIEELIAAAEALRKALLQELLTRGLPGLHTEWRHVPGIGTIPADWEVCKLGELASFITSGSRGWSAFCRPQGAFFVRSQNVVGGEVDRSDAVFVVPPLGVEAVRSRIQQGDVLVSITGEPGNVAVADETLGEAYVSQHVALVRLRDPVLAPFLGVFLEGMPGRAQFRLMSYGQTRPGLNLTNVAEAVVAVPSADERRSIERIVRQSGANLSVLMAEKAGLKALRGSAGDALLTGRLRIGGQENSTPQEGANGSDHRG